jgi:hypothetical protein
MIHIWDLWTRREKRINIHQWMILHRYFSNW